MYWFFFILFFKRVPHYEVSLHVFISNYFLSTDSQPPFLSRPPRLRITVSILGPQTQIPFHLWKSQSICVQKRTLVFIVALWRDIFQWLCDTPKLRRDSFTDLSISLRFIEYYLLHRGQMAQGFVKWCTPGQKTQSGSIKTRNFNSRIYLRLTYGFVWCFILVDWIAQ